MASKRRHSEAIERGRQTGQKSGSGKNRKSKGQKNNRRRRKDMTLGKKIALTVCLFLLLLVLAAIAILASKMGKITIDALDPDQLSISDELEYDEKGYLNVALFGLDTRQNDLEMGTRSDTIIIASLNKETKEIKLASVFRDTYLQQDDGSYNKANAAYSFGEEEQAIRQLNRNLDMNIKHYVTVDFSAMVNVVDALGGIPINVQQSEIDYINGYATSVSENTGVEKVPILFAGWQYLDGVQATSFARIRQVPTLSGLNDDYGRAERQRTVLDEIGKRAKEASLTQLNNIVDQVFPKVKTNFTIAEILSYAKDVKEYNLAATTGFPFDLITMRTSAGDTVIPVTLADNVIQLHRFLFGEDGYAPSSTVTEISNEIAYLTGDGYVDPESVDPNPEGDYVDPGYTDPGYTDPDNTDPDYTDPGYTDPDYTDPDNTDPGYTDPGYTDPDNTDPGYTDPDYTDPNVGGGDGSWTDPGGGGIIDPGTDPGGGESTDPGTGETWTDGGY